MDNNTKHTPEELALLAQAGHELNDAAHPDRETLKRITQQRDELLEALTKAVELIGQFAEAAKKGEVPVVTMSPLLISKS